MMPHDLIIVGGGPVGSRAAEITAPHMKVAILEEHQGAGSPVQCTGLVSPRVVERVGAERAVLNGLKGAVIHFPGGEELEILSNQVKAVIIDREAFDLICHKRALEKGAEFLPGHKFRSISIGKEGVGLMMGTDGERIMRSRMVIAADGYKSRVARSAGLEGARELVRGAQVDLDSPMEEGDKVHVFLGSEVAPGFFAWQIPCGDFTRMGLCVSESNGPPSRFLGRLRERLGKGGKVLRRFGGAIPIGVMPRTYGERLMVVGDAAGQTKPISGGGLFTGMRAAECAGLTALEAMEKEDFSIQSLSRYEERWRAIMGKEIERGYLLRKVFVRLSDRKLDQLAAALRKREMIDLLATGDIDSPSDLVPAALRLMPSLIRFSPQILGSLLSRQPRKA